ncbi:MAG: TDP-N-acetylfucosamine:lipid II N-acetylfucosaminyltransferase [Oleispira sp.]|nr:TDP-N-acetylfucosamine:lipid II N-acetylfucosaminyltransferase [Oleispira sp.]
MKKVIHIHRDYKFISDTNRFKGNLFENELIILDSKHQYNKEYHNMALFYEPDESGIDEILQKVNQADILVIYELDFFKSLIVNKTRKDVLIIWRFFGNELYTRKLNLVLSDNSRSFVFRKLLFWKIKLYFPFFFYEEKKFREAMKRIDLMACMSEEEYKLLSKHWSYLPKFIGLPFIHGLKSHDLLKRELESYFPKEDKLVIGNSKSIYNNHLEILEIIRISNPMENIHIIMPFNYGAEQEYTDSVRTKAKSLRKIHILEDFLPPKEYNKFFNSVAAIVNNSYRQFALGNILIALQQGVKIYLNMNSPTYSWLIKEGFLIFSIVELSDDLKTENIKLTKNQAYHNLNCMKDQESRYTKSDFRMEILKLMKK